MLWIYYLEQSLQNSKTLVYNEDLFILLSAISWMNWLLL